MSRILIGRGARGSIVRDLQLALRLTGCSSLESDGIFGKNTADAVCSFQHTGALPVTGCIDEDTFSRLGQGLPPTLEERCVQLTAAIEGHGYGRAVGNRDGAWLTWGIVGFTLKFGQVQQVVATIAQAAPELITRAFRQLAPQLLRLMAAPRIRQHRWANSITALDGGLTSDWREGFARFGDLPRVQQEQRRLAHDNYFVPALKTARAFGLLTELGAALCFDIHVQNGGVKPRTRAMLQAALSASPPRDELELRRAIAHAVADAATPRFAEDVRARKLAIATGAGRVHGIQLVLENWGLAEIAAPELAANIETLLPA
jgi:peptidoglycan hydrolase-like protein with peptidoglycan-binding domain